MDSMTPEQRLLDIIKKAQDKIKFRKELKVFTKVNIILGSIIIIIVVIFIIDLATFDYRIPEIDIEAIDGSEIGSMTYAADSPEIKQVRIDRGSGSEGESSPREDLVLLGIISGDGEQAVIEHKTLDKTFFLYPGDKFGEFTLRDISDGRVIIDYKGNKIELRI